MHHLVDLPLVSTTYGASQGLTIPMTKNIPLFFVLIGDLVYFMGQLFGNSDTSTISTFFVIVGTAVTLWFRFKREDRELQRDQDIKDQEAKRVQLEKDLHLKGKIEEAQTLILRIESLENKLDELNEENLRLKSEIRDANRRMEK